MPARLIRVHGVVQGVGFRPFVYRVTRETGLTGWVLNCQDGVEIHVEGSTAALDMFTTLLGRDAPAAAIISGIESTETNVLGQSFFVIRDSNTRGAPKVRISPDLPVCDACLAELFDPADRRYLYPYINCTNCGPRFSVIESLPYDRPRTTMRRWPMDAFCAAQYEDPSDRRFHAQPVACPNCGPHYVLECADRAVNGDMRSIEAAAQMLSAGHIVAIKGIGGYHLSCDARNAAAVRALRARKFRKEKPFAVMVGDLHIAHAIVELSAEAENLLCSLARPIVLARAKLDLPGVAPENHELGVMLPYAPLHHLVFAAGAPGILVMTSANRSSEPIAYRDDDARQRLAGLADALIIGERPIARRVDDSVARVGALGPVILRRSRGYAPGAVTTIPTDQPILALGADLKNTITLVVDGQAFVSQHIGDLDHYEALAAFRETIQDFVEMYRVAWDRLTIVHDLHPQYASTLHALDLAAQGRVAIQHHRAHIASVLAEKQAWEKRAVGVSFDGTGFGDDGKIWGGEFFVGSVAAGWKRALHLRPVPLPGGDAAARSPVQCAAGFLHELEVCEKLPDLASEPFLFGPRYQPAKQIIERRLRTFETTSIGRLFDAVAALLGFTREVTFEGQAAIWLEQLARRREAAAATYPFPILQDGLDSRPLLSAILHDRRSGADIGDIARAFHRSLARVISQCATQLCESHSIDLVVLSGGVFQNDLLVSDILEFFKNTPPQIWTNAAVPSNDGGISLGQAASAAFDCIC
jgi:hydrogenase maturation protein HypF